MLNMVQMQEDTVNWSRQHISRRLRLLPAVARSPHIQTCQACDILLDVKSHTQTPYISKTFTYVMRYAMSTDMTQMFRIIREMLDVGGSCWDMLGPSSHPQDITQGGMLDVSDMRLDNRPFLRVISLKLIRLYLIKGSRDLLF